MENKVTVGFLEINEIQKIKPALETEFSSGESVAIKLHMGETYNKNFLKPAFVRQFVDALTSIGCEPFLFDSPTLYRGGRSNSTAYMLTAAKNGFTKKAIGCPIKISNRAEYFPSEHFDVGVCKHLLEADGVFVLSHVKGHVCAGFGAAIKNIGMGALDKKTKGAIHNGGKPVYTEGCTECGVCSKACPFGSIYYKGSRPHFDGGYCSGCGVCILSCPQKLIKPKIAMFDLLLAEGAAVAYKQFKKSYFANAMLQVSKWCDCAPSSEIIAKDVGIVHGKDPVAADKAAYDLLKEREGGDVFYKANRKSPLDHIRAASRLDMGTLQYSLKK
ncbi:MAG: DUF362 domain-containing protein [archaeon]